MKTERLNMKTNFGGNDTPSLHFAYAGMARPILSEDAAQRALSVGEEFEARAALMEAVENLVSMQVRGGV